MMNPMPISAPDPDGSLTPAVPKLPRSALAPLIRRNPYGSRLNDFLPACAGATEAAITARPSISVTESFFISGDLLEVARAGGTHPIETGPKGSTRRFDSAAPRPIP